MDTTKMNKEEAVDYLVDNAKYLAEDPEQYQDNLIEATLTDLADVPIDRVECGLELFENMGKSPYLKEITKANALRAVEAILEEDPNYLDSDPKLKLHGIITCVALNVEFDTMAGERISYLSVWKSANNEHQIDLSGVSNGIISRADTHILTGGANLEHDVLMEVNYLLGNASFYESEGLTKIECIGSTAIEIMKYFHDHNAA